MVFRNLFLSMLSLFAMSAIAAVDTNSCAQKSKQLKVSERQAFIKSCMDQASAPAVVKEKEQANKRATCEQNAKNQKLDGNAKSNYLNECMNKNEAAEVASAAPVKTQPRQEQPRAQPAKKVVSRQEQTAKSCAMQADKKGLKGAERNKFVSKCKAG